MPNTNIILASGSPRRKQLLQQAEVAFTVVVLPTPETYPKHFSAINIAKYIAKKKALAVQAVQPNNIIIAADTIVVLGTEIICKPSNEKQAIVILKKLSGTTHKVITGVYITNGTLTKHFSSTTKVTFNTLSIAQIKHYVTTYKPYDKAGAYAIQEWIGAVGIKAIQGDYYNVMGLPIHKVVTALQLFN